MILFADIGNSRVKWAFYDGAGLQQRGAARHGAETWEEWVEKHWRGLPRPTQAVFVSVAGAAAQSALGTWVSKTWRLEAQFVTSAPAACGIRNAYLEAQRLGADRWVAMIAAHALSAQNSYIVDCGTAITIDALAANGQHLGGVIVPGMRLMREALYRETRQIPAETGVPQLCANSTGDGVWGGALYAVVAAIDGITERMIGEYGAGVRWLTGGDADVVMPYLQAPYRLEPDLIFSGLRVIAGQC